MDGILYFRANDGVHGREPWKSDGTADGTVVVKDIRQGPKGSNPSGLAQLAGTLYFSADDGKHGNELWKSDGTASGTVRVRDIRPGPKGSDPAYLTPMAGTLFFVADDGTHGAGLWKTDGTAAGTVMVKDIYPSSFYPVPFFAYDGHLFFVADDGKHGNELWKSDGTAAGTVMVKDVFPGAGATFVSYPWIIGVAETVFLYADDGVHGPELWKSDGTAAGTVMVKDIRHGRASSNGGHGGLSFAVMGGVLYFTASRDHVAYDEWVDELWRSDGTADGTVMVEDLSPYDADIDPLSLVAAGDSLFMENQGRLVKSDGTSNPSVLVADPRYSWELTDVAGTLYFIASDGTDGSELWKSDGTEAGTIRVRTFSGPDPYPVSQDLVDAGGRLLLSAGDDTHGFELWDCDGTEVGTTMVKDINLGSASSKPAVLVYVPS